MRSWLSTSKLLKTTSFILLVILTICIACPYRQAIADDGDYPDHENNIPPFVHSIIALFDNSPTTGHCEVQDVEFWSNGNSLGYASNLYSISVPSSADCIDFDIQIPIAAPSGNSVICLFNLYALGITNVDYIEFYKQTTYEAVPIYYYTYYSNQFYWITSGQNITASAYYTLRIHIKQGGFSITRYNYANTVTINSYEPANNSSFQEQYAEWYYLTSLLRELDGLSISAGNITIDVDDMTGSIQTIETILRNMRYGSNFYLYQPSNLSSYIGRFYTIRSDGIFQPTSDWISGNSTGSYTVTGSFAIMIRYDSNRSTFPFVEYCMPIVGAPSNMWADDYTCKIAFASALNNTGANSANLDYKYSDFTHVRFQYNTSTQKNYLIIDSYVNQYRLYNDNYPYMLFVFENNGDPTHTITFDLNIAYDTSSFYAFGMQYYSQQAFEHETIMYLDKMYDLLGIVADNTQYVPPPAGSDPETNITNIYDIDIEFNNSVGDISVFESTYQQQLTTYDTQISNNYLVPVSQQYSFGSLNSEFQYLWQNMFSYDVDENNENIGVYGLGLYFLIPLILFVICALFRRVTS